MSETTHYAYLSPEMAQLVAHYGTDLARRASPDAGPPEALEDDAQDARERSPARRMSRWSLNLGGSPATLPGTR